MAGQSSYWHKLLKQIKENDIASDEMKFQKLKEQIQAPMTWVDDSQGRKYYNPWDALSTYSMGPGGAYMTGPQRRTSPRQEMIDKANALSKGIVKKSLSDALEDE